MDIGLALPQYDYATGGAAALPWQSVVERAKDAERLGFASAWMGDHLFVSIEHYGGQPGEHFGYDPIIGLSAVARSTTTLGLGTLVLCSQLRPPKLLLRQLGTLQQAAQGRCTFGVGAGWFEPEYRAAGIPFHRPSVRLSELAETLGILRGLDPPAPLWVGGRGDRLLEVVALHADGWNSVWAWTREAYGERLSVLERACERVGRDPATVTRSLGLYALVGESESDLATRFRHLQSSTPPHVVDRSSLDEWRVGRLVGTVEEVREQAAQWEAMGVSLLIVGTGALPFTTTGADDLELLAAALVS